MITWDDPRTFEELSIYTFEGVVSGAVPGTLAPPGFFNLPLPKPEGTSGVSKIPVHSRAIRTKTLPKGEVVAWR